MVSSTKILEPGVRSYDRLPEETNKSWAAFCIYLDLGSDRSFPKLCQSLGKTMSYRRVLEGWSVKYRWQQRCNDFDTDEQNIIRATLQESRREAHLKKLEKYRQDGETIGNALITQGVAMLNINQQQLLNMANNPKTVRLTPMEIQAFCRVIAITIDSGRTLLAQALGVERMLEIFNATEETES